MKLPHRSRWIDSDHHSYAFCYSVSPFRANRIQVYFSCKIMSISAAALHEKGGVSMKKRCLTICMGLMMGNGLLMGGDDPVVYQGPRETFHVYVLMGDAALWGEAYLNAGAPTV